MDFFTDYLKTLQSAPVSETTEHTFRGALQQLLEKIGKSKNAKIKILHEPKRAGKFGSPDFKISAGEAIIGYAENKAIGENLDAVLKSDQIKKYLRLTDNLLITNYLEWIWMRQGKIEKREILAFQTDLSNAKFKPDTDRLKAVNFLIEAFFSQPPKQIGDAKKLADALATRAKLLKDFLLEELERQQQTDTDGRLFQLFSVFKEHVFHELELAEFADAFAQNLVYGLFLASLNAESETVGLYNAKKFIPTNFRLIRELVNFLDELEQPNYRSLRWVVEEVLTIINHLDYAGLMQTLSFAAKRTDADDLAVKDPWVYFYEDFLAAYDKKLRKSKGVYYTPPPIVNFIVRAVDDILQNTFGLKDGLADRSRVTVLDFATGTGTFLLEIVQQILEKLPAGSGKRDLLIREHVLKNLYGFEYLIAPYTIAHLKLSQYLKDAGYHMQADERLQILLTNTLEPIDSQIKIPFLPALTEESKAAQKVKDQPILVITGNPPYSGISKNNGPWISKLIDTYKIVDGKPFGERKHWLNDDYVKFIRFAQHKMEKVEEGIVAIITNHSFLDNPTFRGMRQSLMTTFDHLYFLDLHGNAKKKEKTPGGGKDENVFDIEQGVAISILVKKTGLEKAVFHADYWGNRSSKYRRAMEDTLAATDWKKLSPNSPFYFFVPKDEVLREVYERGKSISKIFKVNSVGAVTGRDKVNIHFLKNELLEIFDKLRKLDEKNARAELNLGNDSRDWTYATAKKDLEENFQLEKIKSIQYRPFDTRMTLYTGNSRGLYSSPQRNIMQNMLHEGNVGLVTARSNKSMYMNHFYVSDKIMEAKCGESTTQSYLFPLYLFQSTGAGVEKVPNFTAAFQQFLDEKYQPVPAPEAVLGYIYAVLHSPAYRQRYAEFLKSDFPRIPFTADAALFAELAALGWQLTQVHLLHEKPDTGGGDFLGKGDNLVEKPEYRDGKLYINAAQYFDAVPREVYDFHIGGYQVLHKYLKDRRGRRLELDEVDNVEHIVRALTFTIAQMQKIDALTKNWI